MYLLWLFSNIVKALQQHYDPHHHHHVHDQPQSAKIFNLAVSIVISSNKFAFKTFNFIMIMDFGMLEVMSLVAMIKNLSKETMLGQLLSVNSLKPLVLTCLNQIRQSFCFQHVLQHPDHSPPKRGYP